MDGEKTESHLIKIHLISYISNRFWFVYLHFTSIFQRQRPEEIYDWLGYVQGMNEIIGPIYYVFASDSNTEWRGRSFRRRSLVFWFFCEVLKDDKSYPILTFSRY